MRRDKADIFYSRQYVPFNFQSSRRHDRSQSHPGPVFEKKSFSNDLGRISIAKQRAANLEDVSHSFSV